MKNSVRSLHALKNMKGILVYRIETLEKRLARRAYALSTREVRAINARIHEIACELGDVNDRIMDIECGSLYVSYPVACKALVGRKTKVACAPAA